MIRRNSWSSFVAFFMVGCYFQYGNSLCCHGPTKIFLLAGQSNMVGMASVDHMRKLVNESATRKEFSIYWNTTSQDWAERDDVFVKFDNHVGFLKVGFGAPGRGGHFGPELGMGWVVGDGMCNCDHRPIFFLKTAYGGRDLAVDFRPPRSGRGYYPGVKPIHYGWEYRQMIEDITSTLDSLEKIVPGYDNNLGFDLSGFIWFQGWNDMISEPKVEEYEFNLANLIRDVREDLDAPTMPVVVGGMGQRGVNTTGTGADRYYAMQHAQNAVTLYEEFRNNTLYVPTAQFMNYPGNDTYNGGYHYDGRADVYTHIGRAFGRGMLRLLGIRNRENLTGFRGQHDNVRGSAVIS